MKKEIYTVVLSLISLEASAIQWSNIDIPLQVGIFFSDQDKSQIISSENCLFGDRYSINDTHISQALLGTGLYLDTYQDSDFDLSFGLNVFYFDDAQTNGEIYIEDYFHQYDYEYTVENIPVYLAGKLQYHLVKNIALTLDLGLGPNFVITSDYQENLLDDNTLPRESFGSDTTTNLSVMAGLGVRLNNFFGPVPLECGYRYFHLGQGELGNLDSSFENQLNTGYDNAQALLCGIEI